MNITSDLSQDPSTDTSQLTDLLATGTSGVVDDFDDLDQLLKESLSSKSDAKRVQSARRALASKSATDSEREELSKLVAEWELKREWTPVSNTIMFEAQRCCNCGSAHEHFIGFFQRQEHKVSKITRWVKAVHNDSLGKEVKISESPVGICSNCRSSRGWE